MLRPPALVLAAGLLAAAPLLGAQSAMPPMEGMHAFPPPDQLPPPIRMTGIGNSHITIKATPEAQAWFDQGLSLLHDFWDYESARAFEQGVRVDPNCAMCYWGLSQAEGMRGTGTKTYADQALDQAVRLESRASKTDRLYIEAAKAESQQQEGESPKAVALYRELVKKSPRDIQPRIFLASGLGDGYDDSGNPKPGTKEKIAILEAVLKDAPNDSAANHYWIHAMEPGNHPERAIDSAARLASLGRPADTWSTCRATSITASATTRAPTTGSPPRWKPTSAISESSTSASTTTGTTCTT